MSMSGTNIILISKYDGNPQFYFKASRHVPILTDSKRNCIPEYNITKRCIYKI